MIAPLLILTAIVCALAVSTDLSWMVWNVLLAWVPMLLALRPGVLTGLAWVIFFPNAPYLVSDLIHLPKRHAAPEIALWLLAAVLGIMLGGNSYARMQKWVDRRFRNAAGALAMFLCALGIYLGRVERWNSWDAVLHPVAVFMSAVSPECLLSSILIGGFLAFIFVPFYWRGSTHAVIKSEL